jgi:CHAT domain-containing protein/tetratricopeptide (TPR) repeat protein
VSGYRSAPEAALVISKTALFLVLALAGCRPWEEEPSSGGDRETTGLQSPVESTPTGSSYRDGLNAFARWDERSMLRHMRAAWDEESTAVPAIVDFAAYYDFQLRLPTVLRRALDSLLTRDPDGTGLCAAAVLSGHRPLNRSGAPQSARSADLRAHPCAMHLQVQSPGAAGLRHRIGLAEHLWRRYPDSPRLADDLLGLLAQEQPPDRLLGITEEMTVPERHPLVRARGLAWRVSALLASGRQDDAAEAKRIGYALVGQAAPGIHAAYLNGLRRISSVVRLPPSHPLWNGSLTIRRDAEAEMSALAREGGASMAAPFLVTQATDLLDRGLLTESLALWDELIAVADTFSLQFRTIVYLRRGRTLSKLGDLPAAERDLLLARELAPGTGNVERALEVEHNLLHVYEAMGRDDEARRAGRAFVGLTEIWPLRPVRMMAYHDMGTFLQRRGEHEEAGRMFESMLSAIDSLGDYHYWAGEYHELTGNLDQATAYYERSWRESQQDAPRSLVALARIAEATGDDALAEQYGRAHDSALGPAFPEDAPILPGILARAGHIDDALAELERARLAAVANGQTAAWARLTLEAASMELERDRPDRASSLADSAALAAGSVAEAAVALSGRGLSALARVVRGAPGAAETLREVQRALEDAERAGHLQLRADLSQMLGDALSALDRTEEALTAYGRADALTDSVAMSLAHDVVRAGFRAERLRNSNHALAAVVDHADHPDAPAWYVAWSLRRKGRGVPETPGARASEAPEYGDPPGSRTTPWQEAPRVIGEIRAGLGNDDAVIDYVVLDRGVAALVLTREDAWVVVLPGTALALRRQVRQLLAGLDTRVGSFVDLSRTSMDPTLARGLYDVLIAPLEPRLGHRTHLVIVPDAPLHLVPYDALIASGDEDEPEYLLDRYTLTVAMSLQPGARRDPRLPEGSVVAVASGSAPDLSAVSREVDAIVRAFPHREVVRFVGEEATEAAVRNHAGNAAILHVAAHARSSAADPELAHLTLSAKGRDDGLLHAWEIRRLRLRGTLVILSACETAAGRVLEGEGPLSLSRSFLQAGAGAVVGTLWPVGPTAGEVMVEFYRALAAGSSAGDALHSAKTSLRRSHPEPFHWAPFVLVSRGR